MKILVFGLGAIGTVFAVCLKASGNEVYGFVKPEHLSYLINKPLKIRGLFGDKQATLDGFFSDPDEVRSLDLDLIILCVKAFDTEKALNQIKQFIQPKTFLLIAQNGYGNYELASQILGKEKVILSRIIFGAKLIQPGFAEVTVIGDDVVIGQPEKAISKETLNQLAETFNKAGIPTKVSDKVYTILWNKIIYNCALNPLGALFKCNYGELASNRGTKLIMDEIIDEIFEVAKAYQIDLNWEHPEDYKNHFYQVLIPKTASHYPSMYYDLISGKKTEIDALNGAIVKLADQKGIKVPVNRLITLLIKTIEKSYQKS